MPRAIALFLLLVIAAPLANAQCPPATVTLDDGPGINTIYRFDSAVSDGAGGFYVVWRNNTTKLCYVQRVDGAGNEQWTPGGVGFAVGGVQSDPELVAAVDGQAIDGVIVRWSDADPPGPFDIRLQKFDSAGAAQWGPGGVPMGAIDATPETQLRTLAPDGAGGAIVVWEDRDTLTQIKAQRVDSAGSPLWGAGGTLVCSIDQFFTRPTVASDDAGGAYVVWMDQRPSLPQSQHFTQRLDANGVAQWTVDGISLAPTPVTSGALAQVRPDGLGGLLAAWFDASCGCKRAQRVDPSGAFLWGASGVALSNVSALTDRQGDPRIAVDGTGGAVFVWADDRAGVDLWNIYGQKVSAAGALQWAAGGAPIVVGPVDAYVHGAVADGQGGAHLALGVGELVLDTRYQRVDAAGIAVLPGDGLLLAVGPGAEWPNDIVRLDSGNVAVPFSDVDALGTDVDFKAVVLGAPSIVTSTADSGPGSLRAALLAGGGCGSITFAIPGSGPHTITLQSPLPAPSVPTVIDARTQPGYSGTPLVELEGTALGGTTPGLDLSAAGGEVYGLSIWGFTGDAVLLGGTAGRVEECRLGVDAAFNPAGNGGAGVAIVSGTGHVIRNNAMAGNAGLGIDLAPLAAVNANDPGDGDTGANGSQNFPTVELAFGAAPVIQGTLDSAPNTVFDIDVYVSPTCDALYGHGEGLVHLGATTVVTDGTGVATYSLGVAPAGLSGYLTATATGPDGTSEFSTCGATLETTTGQNVAVSPLDAAVGDQPATLVFEVIDAAGTTSLSSGPEGPYLPGYDAGSPARFYEISTTAIHGGMIAIAMGIDPTPFAGREEEVRLLHFETGEWRDVTVRVDAEAGLVYGEVSSLSPFVVALPDVAVPVLGVPGPRAAVLYGATPNPFNPRTILRFDLARPGPTVLRIHNARGRVVRTLVSGELGIGPHERVWDGTDDSGRRLASGVYFARLQVAKQHEVRKLIMIK